MAFQFKTIKQTEFKPSLHSAWGYFQREMIYVSWSIMEIALIAPISAALMPWAESWPVSQIFLWLLLLMLLPFNMIRLMSLASLQSSTQRNVIALSLALLLFTSLPVLLYESTSIFDFRWMKEFYTNIAADENAAWTRDLSIILVTILVWWRGIRLAARGFSVSQTGLRLRLGGLVLAPLTIWAGVSRIWNATPFVLLFFAAALTAVALIRADEIERDQSGKSASLNPQWLAVVLSATLITIAVSGSFAAVISGDTALIVAGWLAPLFLALSFLGASVGGLISYLSHPLLILLGYFIEWLTRLFGGFMATALSQELEIATVDIATAEATAEIADAVERSMDPVRVTWLLLIVALVLVVSLALSRLYQQASLAAAGSERTSSWHRIEGKTRAPLGQRILQGLGLLRNWRAAASIRRVYQEMCASAEASGYPRGESETPYEYLTSLGMVWPQNSEESALITTAYVRVRYGEYPETKEELDLIMDAWDRLKHTEPAPLSGQAG